MSVRFQHLPPLASTRSAEPPSPADQGIIRIWYESGLRVNFVLEISVLGDVFAPHSTDYSTSTDTFTGAASLSCVAV